MWADVIRLLADLGVDLTKPCDAMAYGAPAFWAAKFGREHILLELFNIGIDFDAPCERYGKNVPFVCGMLGNHSAIDRVNSLKRRREYMATKVQAHYRGFMSRKASREAIVKYKAICSLQKICRGELVRIRQGKGRWAARPVGERVKRRIASATTCQALVRGGMVRMRM